MQPGINLDWEKLRLFDTVAEAGSFTEAARRLHMSQPALSRQIAALEDSLGAKLFHRHARGLPRGWCSPGCARFDPLR